MKNIHPIAAIVLACLSVSTSCSKKSGQSGGPPKQSCQLTEVTNVISGGSTSNISFTYNDNGQRSVVEVAGSGFSTVQRVYTYSGNMIFVEETVGGAPFSTDTVTLDSNGQIVSDLNTGIQYGSRSLTTYSFSGAEIKQAVTDLGGGQQVTTNYIWAGGNLTGVASTFGGIPDTTTYGYDNAPAQTADYWSFYQLVSYPELYIKTANRVVSINNGTVTNITYSTDSTGNISKLTETYGGTVETNTYQWSCH